MDIPILHPFEPTPFSVDRNITAYLIPIFSTADLAPVPDIDSDPYQQCPSLNYARKRPFDATDSKGLPVISDSRRV